MTHWRWISGLRRTPLSSRGGTPAPLQRQRSSTKCDDSWFHSPLDNQQLAPICIQRANLNHWVFVGGCLNKFSVADEHSSVRNFAVAAKEEHISGAKL